ncbi:MAG: phosphoadenosine phosphosulfate reductase family protein [Pseudomonadota bacterium]|nr:phosphoadenosine phosphosulfate reductase family protein [Pseudomonadota bacterium]
MNVKELYNISFSGGRTSGYMTKLLLDNFSDKYDFVVTFANTGREHPKTLEFMHNCDKYFGFNTVWLEAVVHHGERVGCTHKIVTYETACRDGSVFEEVIKKYGIPNLTFQPCNREMKLNTMRSYRKSVGADSALTAIGIRADERRRINKSATDMRIEYPLIDIWPTDKQDVLDWWEDQEFDLGIEEFEGNCLGCFKKSDSKHFKQIAKDSSVYDWTERMESLYSSVGPQDGDRVFFRHHRSTKNLLAEYRAIGGSVNLSRTDPYADAGCSESCEFLPTEDFDKATGETK